MFFFQFLNAFINIHFLNFARGNLISNSLGDRKTALFVIISDTDDTFNFVVSILYTQLFNLLCDKADDVYGGRLPVHVRCLLDEFANIGQIPKFEKLIATIRSREISASIILQSQSQLKAIYKDNADTIVGNCDTTLFLGGKEKTTLKEMSEILGKETIDSFNTSETRGRELSHGLNYQKLGKQLMSEDEIAVMDGGKCILQLRGVRPFFSEKYDITKHPKYKYLSDFDKEDSYGIYQLAHGDATRDLRFEPYDRLQATGHTVDRANYELIYTAPLEHGTSLEDIYTRFNIDHPKDFKGHSLSVSDIVVLHQNGENTAHYVNSIGFQNVPEFLQEKQPQLIPDEHLTGEQIRTPRGSFSLTSMSVEQMKEAGYGLHHQSDDGKYLIMGNGTRAFAIAAEQPEKANPLKHIEDTIEQNDNNFDGIINNTPQTPTVDALEQKAKAGEVISLVDLAEAIKADKERGKGKTTEKPSIRAQLKVDKERAGKKKPKKQKSQDLERS